jgi:hypothetical protein
MRLFVPISFVLVFSLAVIYSCTKDKGRNPALAYSNFALRDSCRNSEAFVYYKNDPGAIYSGANGPHGSFKLKFNHKAFAQLTDGGKLPIGSVFSDGSMVVKEILSGSTIKEYAVMYKLSGSWIWAEFTPDLKSIIHSVDSEHTVCTGCHSQSGNRDLVATFNFH